MSASGQLSHFPHWKWNKQYLLLLLSGVSALIACIVVYWRDTIQALHLLPWLIETEWNKHCLFMLLLIEWSVCILPHVGETYNTTTAFTITHWKWNKQCLLSGVSALSIVACWRDTQHKHCIYFRDSLNWNKQCLFILSGVSAYWRDTQHKHCIYCNSLKVKQIIIQI